jgi:hypothetical protein
VKEASFEDSRFEDGLDDDDFKDDEKSISRSIDYKSKGLIIVAEDQYINLQVMKDNLEELKEIDRCKFCYDG